MGGLLGGGSFLRSVYEHEDEIRGTKEELGYYSHDSNSNEMSDETGMRDAGVFTVEGVDNGTFNYTPKSRGYCKIIVHTDNIISPTLSRRAPITLNQFNNIAKKYAIEKYILYSNNGSIISSAIFGVDGGIVHLFNFDIALRRFGKYKKVLLPNEVENEVKVKPKTKCIFTTDLDNIFTTDELTVPPTHNDKVYNKVVNNKSTKESGKFIQYWFVWNGWQSFARHYF